MIIDFKNLVSKYDENLVSQLRGFGEEDFLKFWVPDSEKLKSLLNLIDALFESQTLNAKIINLNIDLNEIKDLEKLNGIAIQKIDANELTINIDKQKYIDFKKIKNKISLKNFKNFQNKTISELEAIKYDENIGEEYDELLNRIKKLNFNLNKEFDKKKYRNYFFEFSNNLKLMYYINKTSGIVEHAFHNSEQLDKKSIILDVLCSQILNKGIEEVADHGVIYLEFFLRSSMKKKDNFGISLPRNSARIFNLIEKNLRLSRDDFYQKENIERKSVNKEFRIVSKRWATLNFEKQKSKVDEILQKYIFRNLNINSSDIVLNRVIQGNGIEFLISKNLEGGYEDNKLFKIEQVSKEKIE